MSQKHESLKTKDEDQTEPLNVAVGSQNLVTPESMGACSISHHARLSAREERRRKNREANLQRQALRDEQVRAEREERRRLNRLEYRQHRLEMERQAIARKEEIKSENRKRHHDIMRKAALAREMYWRSRTPPSHHLNPSPDEL